MNWIKKFAQWILRERLERDNATIELLWREKEDLENKNWELEHSLCELTAQQSKTLRELWGLKDTFVNQGKVIVSQLIFETIVKMLPDPNKIGTNNFNLESLKMHTMNFVDRVGACELNTHQIKIVGIRDNNFMNLKGYTLKLHITDYDLNVSIPVVYRSPKQRAYGVDVEASTYLWDFNAAGLQVLSNEAWELMHKTTLTARKVFNELGLL